MFDVKGFPGFPNPLQAELLARLYGDPRNLMKLEALKSQLPGMVGQQNYQDALFNGPHQKLSQSAVNSAFLFPHLAGSDAAGCPGINVIQVAWSGSQA